MMRTFRHAFVPVVCLFLAACGGTPKVDDPLADIRNPKLNERRRVDAINETWSDARSGKLDMITAREELKTVAWSPGFPVKMRMAALTCLASDPSDKGSADTRAMFRLMLPREPDPTVTAYLASTSASRGWTETTPALVRSLSRVWPGVADSSRPEYAAIVALNPGKTVPDVVYAIFLNPPEEGGAFGAIPPERVRSDAWDLLARIDADGSVRASLMVTPEAGAAPGPVADMQASLQDLRCLPLSGDELRWLSSLHDFTVEQNKLWWEQTAAVIAGLDRQKADRLQLRHLEPIRWAASTKPEWLGASREQLLSELNSRIAPREISRRKAGDYSLWRPAPEKLADWEAKMSWADVLAMLVIDEAIHEQRVIDAVFAQADMDREDRSAEYGGVIRCVPGTNRFEAVLYPPRPGSRRGDKQFVASTDMIEQSNHALVHYHFHVQDLRNSQFAGPSPDDLAYAARYGRSCVVLTSVGADALDADCYQPDGAVIDLGYIRLK